MEKISFITFTKNSGNRISTLLNHVKDVVDEMIVIDGFSDDDTVKIAKKYGARVYLRKPWGFVEPDRMFALRMTSHDWVLYLDDDERLNKKLGEELHKLVENAKKNNICAYRINRINHIKRKLLFGPFYPDKQIRIFNKQKTIFKGLVHEVPFIKGPIIDLPEHYYILHSINFSCKKQLLYAHLEALMYSKYQAKNLLRIGIFHLTPLSTPLLYFYHIGKAIYKRNPLNMWGIFYTWKLALYDSVVHVFMLLRTKKEIQRAKIINKKGLIQLLKL